jgi:hypothetical protein
VYNKDYPGTTYLPGNSLVVDVHVVDKPWTAIGTWTAGQAALVTANADGASLQQLAYDITGVESDASLLGHSAQIKRGEQIDVTPLLQELEQRMRTAVKAAALVTNKNATFGSAEGVAPCRSFKEAQVKNVFDDGGGPGPMCDCASMMMLEMAYGLITQLNPGEFDAIGVSPVGLTLNYWSPSTGGRQPGDWIKFSNYRSYTGGMWGEEQTIMLAADSYYGWGRSNPHSADWWRSELLREYTGPGSGTITLDQIPQPIDEGFINVPKYAMQIFNLRTKQGSYSA